jgi:hypothetical protein
MNVIFDATIKTFSEEGIGHALHFESQIFKGRYKVFHYAIFFQISQMVEMVGVSVKDFIYLYNKICLNNICLASISTPLLPFPSFWIQIEDTIMMFGQIINNSMQG